MKFGTFVLGGLAGAAVVMLMQSRTMSGATNGLSQMFRNRMDQVKDTAIEKGLSVKFDQVAQMAAKEPHVKRQINEILNENNQQLS